MLNKYYIKGKITDIEIENKKNKYIVRIDTEDLDKVNLPNKRWLINISKKYWVVSTKDNDVMSRLIVDALENEYVTFNFSTKVSDLQDNIILDFRKINLKKVENIQNYVNSDKRIELLKKGINEKRYTKEYSKKIGDTRRGEENIQSILTEEDAIEIRRKYSEDGMSQYELASEYNLSRGTISNIIRYITWSNISEDESKNYRIYKEDNLIEIDFVNLENTIVIKEITTENLPFDSFTLSTRNEFIFVENIENSKIYVEVRDISRKFILSFDLIYPKTSRKNMLHPYVLGARNPRKYNKKQIQPYIDIMNKYINSIIT